MEMEIINRIGKTEGFDTREGFTKKLKELCNNDKDIEEVVQHECSHFYMAEDLGYKPLFCLDWFEEDFNGKTRIEIEPYVWAEGLFENPKDLFMISLAPERPSTYDIENANFAICFAKNGKIKK